MQIILRVVQIRDCELGSVDPRKVAIWHGQSIQDEATRRGPSLPSGHAYLLILCTTFPISPARGILLGKLASFRPSYCSMRESWHAYPLNMVVL